MVSMENVNRDTAAARIALCSAHIS